MKKTLFLNVSKVLLTGAMVFALPGCDMIKSMFGGKKGATQQASHDVALHEDSGKAATEMGKVLLLIDKKPVLYEREFTEKLEQILQMYPQLKGTMTVETMPAPLKQQILDELIKQKLIVKWGEKRNLENDPKFQKDLQEAHKLVHQHIIMQSFEKHVMDKVYVSDSDVRAEYDKNKERYVKVQGGSQASGVSFPSQDAALAFFNKVQSNSSKFDSIAQADYAKTYKNWGRISKESRMPILSDAVRKAIFDASSKSVKIVRDGATYWVIYVGEKANTEYFDFKDIKGQLENMIRTKKLQEELDKELKALRAEFSVEVMDKSIVPSEHHHDGEAADEAEPAGPQAVTVG